MSRILVETAVNGSPLQLVMGWDRPLQHCFLQVELDDEQFELPEFEKVAAMSVATDMQHLSLEDIKEALAAAEVPVSDQALVELAKHRDENIGNAIVKFDRDGRRTQIV
jgi:hypothetical protein